MIERCGRSTWEKFEGEVGDGRCGLELWLVGCVWHMWESIWEELWVWGEVVEDMWLVGVF